ncbi:uncharacterized protein LOC133906359 [Phragmites australis]|uniref:uncharacterized protein LOC133906359 n=1 Tax=Phragmites australis TaxID=29695 RepID=UPI002D78C9B1|nr:uncharacterized protein LOC133906359 [Phragmites australis]XP_062204218.1 uncharacterized protein LOC133906359 [Phragmites australis]
MENETPTGQPACELPPPSGLASPDTTPSCRSVTSSPEFALPTPSLLGVAVRKPVSTRGKRRCVELEGLADGDHVRAASTTSLSGTATAKCGIINSKCCSDKTSLKAVHIAGTKGKGSTAAFQSNVMREQGYNVGCYSSPHLQTIRERISVGNNVIQSTELAASVITTVGGNIWLLWVAPCKA